MCRCCILEFDEASRATTDCRAGGLINLNLRSTATCISHGPDSEVLLQKASELHSGLSVWSMEIWYWGGLLEPSLQDEDLQRIQ